MNFYVKQYLEIEEQNSNFAHRNHHERYLGELSPKTIQEAAKRALEDPKEVNCLIWVTLERVFCVSSGRFSDYRSGVASKLTQDVVRGCLLKLAYQKDDVKLSDYM